MWVLGDSEVNSKYFEKRNPLTHLVRVSLSSVIILNSVTYLRGPRDQGVDQKLHGELKRRVLSLVHELLEAVSFACALYTVKFVSYAQSKSSRKGWGGACSARVGWAGVAYLFDFHADEVSGRDVCVAELLHELLTLRSLATSGRSYKITTRQIVAPKRQHPRHRNLPRMKVILGLPSCALTSILSVYASVVILNLFHSQFN